MLTEFFVRSKQSIGAKLFESLVGLTRSKQSHFSELSNVSEVNGSAMVAKAHSQVDVSVDFSARLRSDAELPGHAEVE